MKYADIKANDIADGEKVCVSFWTQGCPHHCEGCHNPETWSFNDGIESDEQELIDTVIKLINKNNVDRNFSVLGGEPLCEQNIEFVSKLVQSVRKQYPNITVYLWTGYKFEDLLNNNFCLENILPYISVLIDGEFILSQRNIHLYLRGSENQRVIDVQQSLKNHNIVLLDDLKEVE